MSKTAIVVPCYNEADRLPVDTFKGFMKGQSETRFIFVDDGSSDATFEILSDLAQESGGRCEVLKLSENQGKAEAVRQGMNMALASGAEIAGFWDADLATSLESIALMQDPLNRDPELLAVFGSRVRMLGHEVERDPIRHYAGRVFATAVSLMLQIPIYDSQCGAKLFRTSPLTRDIFVEPFVSRWIFDVELLARFRERLGPEQWARAGSVIKEYPLESWRDVSGSKVGGADFIRSFSDLTKIYQRYIAD